MKPRPQDLDPALSAIVADAAAARAKWGAFRSTHEFLGVIIEELDEVKSAIHRNDDDAARREAIQVAAVAYRFARDGWTR